LKLTERVYVVGSGRLGLSLTSDYDCHIYLLDGGEEAALVDAGVGMSTQEIFENIAADGFDAQRIRHLLLTHGHADHAGGTAVVRRRLPGLRVYAHPVTARRVREADERGIGLDAAKRAGNYPEHYVFEPAQVEEEIVDGQVVTIGDLSLRALETPGHCAGHHAFVLDCHGVRVLFSGDLVFFGGHILLQNTSDCDLQAYIRSLKRLQGMDVDVLLPGHLSFALTKGQRHIDAALEILNRGAIPPQAI
jgi:hydroxyacylglutathione hydrolase